MSYISAIILGLVQGVAEFLPISSSGHLSLFQHFFQLTDVEHDHMFFSVLLHLGTLVAVFFAYRRDIAELLREFFCMVHLRKLPQGQTPDIPARRMILMIIVATLPLLLVFPIKDRVELLYQNTFFIAFALVLTGTLLFVSDRMPRGHKTAGTATMGDAILVGLAQAVAVVPGLSRSGTTISAGMARGFDRTYAVKFSFLMSIPAVLGANILSIVDAVKAGIDTSLLPMYLVGVLVAMVSGYASISLLRFISRKGRFGGFAYYCWGAGLVTLILSLIVP
ncbi:MAG TPA: undecaprenyl-diphosphate phosphatase [Candidatus Avoscillospira avistercoris]|uniref:Undecaprenyl-diphosphatase n=1 Tax=Candidatus Avoscillospira avistercoris TaxID=2840707 RepID=A0A9D1JTT3_9FIRM|nr:undecaprenyl-diphosphate phosphatase [Candidatus Avoscillospira avistercoris]